MVSKKELKNEKIRSHPFLKDMYADSYFPSHLVDKIQLILVELCQEIEVQKPKNLKELYQLTHKSTIQINKLENAFFEHDSEIETAARECISDNFNFIAESYSFDKYDPEEIIATREW